MQRCAPQYTFWGQLARSLPCLWARCVARQFKWHLLGTYLVPRTPHAQTASLVAPAAPPGGVLERQAQLEQRIEKVRGNWLLWQATYR